MAETRERKPPTRRAERRAATIAEIKLHARRQLATEGTGGLSLRAIARDMRMAPAALFRYFDSQASLITTLCVDAYDALADAMNAAEPGATTDPAGHWRAVCGAARQWALANPGEFALINGTPIPGYRAAPEETGPAAGRVIEALAGSYSAAVEAGVADPAATGVPSLPAGPLLTGDGAPIPDSPVPGILLNAWASILGFIAAEVFGSLRELISDADALYDSHVRTVMRGMGYQG
ncbi:TetR/AcrR family transcriptional regulator [Nocardia cyriacigeorgica]|uniref:TetR/AcrR family transcriptional regulator n=1 Tax=Nocardia cyriacigeorgica TaxID=135487 RepID=A0A5R8P8Q3_9NOCA|nr:TetR/AcrR family transcriptional regulator [Nocardia cyriacigeorgica]TLG00335.1 TetR/AcrR family transcriptional regulator [Nocardia cyriacigeorgica]